MKYEEITADLFSMPEEYCLAHCISADFAMGKGIAVLFNEKFDMKNRLNESCSGYLSEWISAGKASGCIKTDRVFNLITKERYYHKPTYEALRGALILMKEQCASEGITKVAMPLIGCGLDKLQWDKVSAIIKEVFGDTDIEITVCKL